MIEAIALLGGIAVLTVGGEVLVRGASRIAGGLGMSPLLVGSTIVAFGTSLPEMVVSVDATLTGQPGIAIGNVVGSNIANILLILGIAALIWPIRCDRQAVRQDNSFNLGTGIVFALLVSIVGYLDLRYGIAALVLILAYQAFLIRRERVSTGPGNTPAAEQFPAEPRWKSALQIVIGLALLPLGAHLVVDSAVAISAMLGVSSTIVGLTVVAVGTSLPELATSVVAAVRRHGDIALGNVVGSNCFNLLGILGVCALFGPLDVPEQIVRLDVWVMLAATLLVMAVAFFGYRIGRVYGFVFLTLYVAYTAYLYAGATGA